MKLIGYVRCYDNCEERNSSSYYFSTTPLSDYEGNTSKQYQFTVEVPDTFVKVPTMDVKEVTI